MTLSTTFLGLLLFFAGLGLLLFLAGGEDSHDASTPGDLGGSGLTQILIDITPHDFPNGINLRSNGVIAVAILTNADFDARTVDPHTARFGKYGYEAPAVQATLVDVDGDGDTDLLVHFRIQDTGIHCGVTTAIFTGYSVSGQASRGSDSVVPVGCR